MIYSNPSFETEKYTHAFGAMIWWVVSLISMFTVGIGVTVIGLCGASVLKIISTFLQDNMVIVLMMFFAVAIIIFFIGLLRFASVLTTSYKFDGNTIIKGTLAVRAVLSRKSPQIRILNLSEPILIPTDIKRRFMKTLF